MTGANIWRRRNGEYGSSCGGCADTGHTIIRKNGGYTVYSRKDMQEDHVICRDAPKAKAEEAIAQDWRAC